MADSSEDVVKTISSPSLTCPMIEPHKTCAFDETLKSEVMFCDRSVQSLKMAAGRLKEELSNISAGDEEFQPDPCLQRNGFREPEDYVMVGGDGVVSICLCLWQEENDHQELIMYDHITQATSPLGYLPLSGYYNNFGMISGRWGCCVREPGVLCQLSQNGDFVVVFGPRDFAHEPTHHPEDTPYLLVYHLTTPAKLLFKRKCRNIPFMKCDPIGISICPASIQTGQYRVALVTESMEIRFWDATTKSGTRLKMESVSPCLFNRYPSRNPLESSIRFSPDGRCLSVLCFLEDEQQCACVLLDTNPNNLEPLCWVAFNESRTWLRWLLPIFSSCGTEVVLASYLEQDYKYDLTKFELLFHKVPYTIESLQSLCRIVILQHVHPSSLSKLPLPKDLIEFLVSGKLQGYKNAEYKEKRRKCNLL